jgi:hypothetical protein
MPRTREYIPLSVGHDAQKLILLARRSAASVRPDADALASAASTEDPGDGPMHSGH